MKNLHIFKRGTHTDSGGKTLDFGDDMLNNVVDSYNPSLHEAPIVIGHPATDDPAMGWVESVKVTEEGLHAEPKQVNADFEELVKAGSYKKISASFYMPDSPSNPSPGNWYLRHVGFLGGQAPAIKGLGNVQFSAAEEGVLEFEDSFEQGYSLGTIATLMQNIKKFIIRSSGIDEADTLIPDYMVKELERSSERMINPPTPETNQFNEENEMDLEQAKAKIAQLESDNESLTNENGTLKGKVTEFEEASQTAAEAARKTAIANEVEALVKGGHIAPAERENITAFCELLDGTERTVSFGEGDAAVEVKGRESFIKFLQSKTVVDFNERTREEGKPNGPMTSADLSRKAVAYQEEQKQAGIHVDIVDAVNHIQNQAE
jgi:hypothetical protein